MLQQQDCPLCLNGAAFRLVDFNNRKHFRCSVCTEFQISVGAEKRLAEAPSEWRSSYSAKAKAHPQGMTLVITLPARPKREGEANAVLVGDYVKDSDLPGRTS